MTRTSKKLLLKAFLALALTFVFAACSSDPGDEGKENGAATSEEGTPKQGGEATFAYQADVSNFDPIKGNAGSDHALLWPVYETLIKFTPDLEPEPGLAESWEFEDDTTLVLTLREGVNFHDGTPFNAEAVKFNIERANSDDSNISDLENIESVEVVDDHTVKLHLSQPDSSLLLALSDRGGMMVSPEAVEEHGDDFSQNPVGAGPFKVVNHVPNGEIVYEAFEDYWQEGQPYLDKMTVKVMGDENTRINALKSGEVDYAFNVSAANADNLENDPNIVLKSRISAQMRMLYLNADKEPTNETAVRRAILHGIDRDALIQAINFGKGEPAHQAFPSEYWAHDSDVKIDYDPEKAKQILEEAGIDEVTLKLSHYSNAYDQRIAEAIKSQLSEVGINVELQSMELNAAVTNYFNEKEVPAFLSSWTGRPDPQMTINNLFSADSFYNTGNYSTDEIENLIDQAFANYEQEDRAELYGQISEKAILEEAIIIPLFFEERFSAMNQSLKGYEPNLLAKPLFSTTWKEE